MKAAEEIDSIRKRAAWVAFVHLLLGLLAMLASLQEGSTGWALYIWLIALQGIAIGCFAGGGWSDHLLERTPPHRRTTAVVDFLWSLLTFWAPILAAFIFGAIMAKTLPDAARPRSSLAGNGGNCAFQSWVMCFNAVGCTWLIVWLDSRKLLNQASSESGDNSVEGV